MMTTIHMSLLKIGLLLSKEEHFSIQNDEIPRRPIPVPIAKNIEESLTILSNQRIDLQPVAFWT